MKSSREALRELILRKPVSDETAAPADEKPENDDTTEQ